jgi:hypothetical protein
MQIICLSVTILLVLYEDDVFEIQITYISKWYY